MAWGGKERVTEDELRVFPARPADVLPNLGLYGLNNTFTYDWAVSYSRYLDTKTHDKCYLDVLSQICSYRPHPHAHQDFTVTWQAYCIA